MSKRLPIWRIFGMLVALTLIILATGVLFLVFGRGRLAERGRDKLTRTRRKAELTWLTLTGRRIDVGGYRLHLECSGKGRVTVLMDAGLNMTTSTWNGVLPELSKITRVCVYDRAGLGDSDPGPQPRTSQLIVNELHTALTNAGVVGPYVLAGHSFGGLNMRLYANQYPKEVVGIVLIDASHEDQYERLASLMSPAEKEKFLRHEGGGNTERVDILASAKQVLAAPVPNIPLVVLSAGQRGEKTSVQAQQVHDELQARLVTLTPQGRQIIAARSGHFIQDQQPDLVINAIRDVVLECRSKLSQ
jgi:pimeloyl-ACP methyl ester carboxylesterase